MGNYPPMRVQRSIYTHIFPCATFGESITMHPRVSGFLFKHWEIQLVENGRVYRAQEYEEMARHFPDAWGVFIFRTTVKLSDEMTWRLMELLGIQAAFFNWCSA